MKESKLTIVLCGRNDRYGGDFKKRLTNSLIWNHRQAIRFKAQVELIFVEHNALKSEPLLEDEIDWPKSECWETKVIQHHAGERSNLFEEFTAKNFGIKMATGNHVLVSNADVLLPDWLFEHYDTVRENKFLLADRLNVHRLSEEWMKMESTADEYCMKGGIFLRPRIIPHRFYYWCLPKYLWLRRHIYRMLPFLLKPGVPFLLEHHFTACGDFMLGHNEMWKQLKGFRENTDETAHVDSLLLLEVITRNFEVSQIPEPVLHQHHEHRYSFRKPTEAMNGMLQILLDEVIAFQNRDKKIL